jgi:hypothetical protein
LPPNRLHALVLAKAYREVEVEEGGRTLPMAQLTLRSLAAKAAKGDARAQRQFAEMVSVAEAKEQQMREEMFEVMLQYKTRWSQELSDRQRRGLPPPNPMPCPHPDDIFIDPRTGETKVQGPMTEDERDHFELLKGRMLGQLEEVKDLDVRVKRASSESRRRQLAEERASVAAHLRRMMAMMDSRELDWPRLWPVRELEIWRITEMVRAGEPIPREFERRMTELGSRRMLLHFKAQAEGRSGET